MIYPDTMRAIQREIYENGPVTAYIDVYADLITYHEGVYYV